MIKDYPYAGISFLRDSGMPVPPGEERDEIDVGPVRPVDFARTRRCPRLEAGLAAAGGPVAAGGPPVGEAHRVLHRVERNLTALIRAVPMAKIEDLPPAMQPHVVGVPRTWVQLFRRLANAVVHNNRANRPRP